MPRGGCRVTRAAVVFFPRLAPAPGLSASMGILITRRQSTALAAGAVLGAPATGQAQAWPSRFVRLIVPLAPGGPTDLTARLLGEPLSRIWGQQVVIENKPGAGGNLAAETVARSDP